MDNDSDEAFSSLLDPIGYPMKERVSLSGGPVLLH